jgi:RNA polymerase sigma-70 factor (ECF subfamily)
MAAEGVEAVVQRACAGDEDAFSELYSQYRRRVFGLCRHLLGSVEAAEDATSEAFLRAKRTMSSYDSALPFQRWMLSIAGHYCVDQLRRRRVERRLFEPGEFEEHEPAGPGPTPLAELLASQERELLRAAVAELPERFRLPLVLRYYSDLSYDQIAALLGLKRNHVATLLFRGKKELRRTLVQKEKIQ